MATTPPGSAPLPELVVKALGRIALVGLLIGGGLIYLALRSPGPVDPAVTGVIGTFLAITSVAVGGLGAILSTTRSASDPPTPVTVTNPPADPVLTTDVEPSEPPATPARKKATARKRRPRA